MCRGLNPVCRHIIPIKNRIDYSLTIKGYGIRSISQVAGGSNIIEIGGEGRKVGELSAVVIFEFEVYPEPKILTKAELTHLMRLHGTTVAVAKFLGCSQPHVSERLNG